MIFFPSNSNTIYLFHFVLLSTFFFLLSVFVESISRNVCVVTPDGSESFREQFLCYHQSNSRRGMSLWVFSFFFGNWRCFFFFFAIYHVPPSLPSPPFSRPFPFPSALSCVELERVYLMAATAVFVANHLTFDKYQAKHQSIRPIKHFFAPRLYNPTPKS